MHNPLYLLYPTYIYKYIFIKIKIFEFNEFTKTFILHYIYKTLGLKLIIIIDYYN